VQTADKQSDYQREPRVLLHDLMTRAAGYIPGGRRRPAELRRKFRRRRLSADRLSRATAAVEDKQFAGSVCIWAGLYMGCGPLPGWALGLCTYGTPPEPGLVPPHLGWGQAEA
jgi:hypothetical protein